MNLKEIITGNQTVQLIDPYDCDGNERYFHRGLTLLLRDNDTGELKELTIEPDMAVMPDEALLVFQCQNLDEPPELLAMTGVDSSGEEFKLQ